MGGAGDVGRSVDGAAGATEGAFRADQVARTTLRQQVAHGRRNSHTDGHAWINLRAAVPIPWFGSHDCPSVRRMTPRLGTRLLALLVPVALLAPAAAYAESVSIDDAAGDAKAVNMEVAFGELATGEDGDGPFFLDAPAETSADVVRTTIDHARKRLTLTLQFRDLVAVQGHSVEFRIITPEGRYILPVDASGGRTSAMLIPGRGSVVVSSDGDDVSVEDGMKPCRTVRARYDVVADTLTASAPTACLGQPKWVQVAAGISRTSITPQGDGSINLAGWADDAFRPGISLRSLGRSPKVRRG